MSDDLQYYMDDYRHIVCLPYSLENLHLMAKDLGISKWWFHKNHYDCPKRKFKELSTNLTKVTKMDIYRIIKGVSDPVKSLKPII